MNKTAALALAGIAIVITLTGCSAAERASAPSTAPAAGAMTPTELAVPLGPAEPADGRVAPGATVPTPVSPSTIAGVFCAISIDDEVTEYRATQISQYGAYLTSISEDTAHFSPDMGPATAKQAGVIGTRLSALGWDLKKLTDDKNVDLPDELAGQIAALCADPLT